MLREAIGPLDIPSRRRMRDRCGSLKDAWYAAGLSSELRTRRPLGRTILEQPLVLWRDAKGCAVAMEDRCAHRGAPLSKGKLIAGTLACPYHGWTYDSKGHCIHVPSEGTVAPSQTYCVRRFPVAEQNGLVWAWMGDGKPTCAPWPIPHRNSDSWASYYMVTQFKNDVTHLVQNFMDVPHTTFVHRGWFRRPAQQRVRAIVERKADSVLVTYEQPDDAIGFTGSILNPRRAPIQHTDKFYMPSTTRVDYLFGQKRGFTITSTCTPRGPYDTVVYTSISYRLGWLNILAPLWLPMYTRKVIRQDVDIMRWQGDNLQRFNEARFSGTAADRLHEFIECLREHAQGEGSAPAPLPRTDEIFFWI